MAVVRMNDQDTKIEDCLAQNRNFDPCEEPKRLCSVGYIDKQPVACALKSLEAGEKGFTPLNDTLKEVFDLLLTRSYPTDNAVVIVFTDGMEEAKDGMSGGDASVGYEVGTGMKVQSEGFNDILGPNQARDLYVNGVNGSQVPVPVIVMHLQPPATSPYKRGRDAKLQQLACDTGGEYVFLESASLLTKSSNLQTMISNRIRGVWHVDVDTSLAQPNFEAGDYLLSTSLQVTLGGVQRTADLSKSRDTQSIQDSRIWLQKTATDS